MRTAKPFKPGDTCKRGHLWTPKTLRVRSYKKKYLNGKVYECTMRECRACANLLKADQKRRNPTAPKPRKTRKPEPPRKRMRVNPPKKARPRPAPHNWYEKLHECWIEDYRALYPRP